MRLSGIELRNFRSIGSEPVILSPLQKCNILVGQNNSGKSNVLRAVKVLSDKFAAPNSKDVWLSELDCFRRSQETPFSYKLWFEADDTEDAELVRLSQTKLFWFLYSWPQGQSPRVTDTVFIHVTDIHQNNELLKYLTGSEWAQKVNPARIRDELLADGDRTVRRLSLRVPTVQYVPEFRQIREGDKYGYDGIGLVNLLARFQMPRIGQDSDQKKFERIQNFFRRLLHLPNACLEIPRGESTLIIKNEDIRLPLTHFGTGMHELLIILTAVTSIDNAICCIEEPEIHLHARLQRELVDFLIKETSNQYLLTTHSPALINVNRPDVQIFHLKSLDGATVGHPVLQTTESVSAIRDLGLRASDLLQANCIIWVEGRSDVVYLERWIELLAPDLEEGRDYVFMCYRQLPELNIDCDLAAEELVNVLQMNQNAIVVIDSDCSGPNQMLAAPKQALKTKCEASGGLSWVTEGREIENYLPPQAISRAIKDLRGCDIELSVGLYDEFSDTLDQRLKKAGAKPINYCHDKLNYSRKFAEHCTVESMTGPLRQHVEETVSKIRKWSE